MRVRPARFPSPGGPSHPPACANLQHPDLTVWRPPPARAWAGGGLARPVPDGGIQSRTQRALVPPCRTRMRLARRTRSQCAFTPLIPVPPHPARQGSTLGSAGSRRVDRLCASGLVPVQRLGPPRPSGTDKPPVCPPPWGPPDREDRATVAKMGTIHTCDGGP